jgi:hypothetical protein
MDRFGVACYSSAVLYVLRSFLGGVVILKHYSAPISRAAPILAARSPHLGRGGPEGETDFPSCSGRLFSSRTPIVSQLQSETNGEV